VEFGLADDFAGGQADEAGVEEFALAGDGLAACDDGESVAGGQFAHELGETFFVTGEAADAFDRRLGVFLGEELHGDELGHEHEVGVVVGRDIDEVGDLALEIGERGDLAHLVLDAGEADLARAGGGLLVVGVEPLDEAAVVVALGVVEVVGHDAAQDEALAELETEHEVLQLAGDDALGVLVGGHVLGVFVVVPEATAGEDAALVEASAELAAGLVEGGADLASAVVGMHADVGAVEGVGGGVVVGEVAAVGDAGPGVVAKRVGAEVDDQGGGGADDVPVDFGDDLALGKDALVTEKVALAPDDVFGGEDRVGDFVELNEGGNVGPMGFAEGDGALFFAGHGRGGPSGICETRAGHRAWRRYPGGVCERWCGAGAACGAKATECDVLRSRQIDGDAGWRQRAGYPSLRSSSRRGRVLMSRGRNAIVSGRSLRRCRICTPLKHHG